MNHHATPDFWTCYRALPEEVQKLADQAYEHLKHNPQYPSVRLKKAGRFWSARVGLTYRALAVEAPDGLVWFWIGLMLNMTSCSANAVLHRTAASSRR